MLSICYMTNRVYPCWEWFLDSLRRELETDGDPANVKTVVVDFHQRERIGSLPAHVLHVPPKPCVWQGPHRLTTRDYFAASNARNTALCYAQDGWIAYVDDLSVLLPGWLKCVRQAMREDYIVLGAYRKVLGLDVVDGRVVGFTDHHGGHDSRWPYGSDTWAVKHGGGALFGCSLAGPVECFLKINGWEEKCDGMGYEDSQCGIMLSDHQCFTMKYDRRMMTYESEEAHHYEAPFLRVDKPNACGGRFKDASHAILHQTKNGKGVSQNDYHLRDLRADILAGGEFPIPTGPTHHWPDNQPLREM